MLTEWIFKASNIYLCFSENLLGIKKLYWYFVYTVIEKVIFGHVFLTIFILQIGLFPIRYTMERISKIFLYFLGYCVYRVLCAIVEKLAHNILFYYRLLLDIVANIKVFHSNLLPLLTYNVFEIICMECRRSTSDLGIKGAVSVGLIWHASPYTLPSSKYEHWWRIESPFRCNF